MPTIAEIAGGDDFEVLLGALQFVDAEIPEAGLVAALSGDGPLTVFAPNDAAFGRLAADLGFGGDADDASAVAGFLTTNVPAETLRAALEYHVLPGDVSAADVAAAETLATLQGGTIRPDLPTLVDMEPDLLDATLIATDIDADNGTVHVIDRVLLPVDLPGNDAPTITGIVAASGEFDSDGTDFDLLLASVQAAGLADTLNDAEADLTVFAPNDAAFTGLATALGYAGDAADEGAVLAYLLDGLALLNGGDAVGLLTTVLQYHVAAGSLQSSQVVALDEIETLAGASVGVSTDDGVAFVDLDPDLPDAAPVALDVQAANGIVHVIDGVLIPADLLASDGADAVDFVIGDGAANFADLGDDADYFSGLAGDDIARGGNGNDVLMGGAGSDRLNGGDGDDTVMGGSEGDLVFGGAGDDRVDGQDGNDVIFGMDGDDVLDGRAGSDTIAGQDGADTITGGGLGDQLFGNAGDDFLNGGFGFDRLNGGEGADEFFHLGVADHGSDWIQDFGEGDVLVLGIEGATVDDFVVQTTHSGNETNAGDADVQEAFVTYVPTGQILFALVDGDGLDEINLRSGQETFDLLA